MYKKRASVTKEEMTREIHSVLTNMNDISVRLKSTSEALRLATDKDINFHALDQCKKLLDELGDVDVQSDLKHLLSTLMGRAETRMTEFKSAMIVPRRRNRIVEVSDQAAE